MRLTTGLLVCVEGVDGAGKTTLVRALVDKLASENVKTASLHLRSLFERDLEDQEGRDGPALTAQEKAFVSYSRLYDFYLTDIVPAITACDVILLDRYKWSYLVRWACRDVRFTILSALSSTCALVPDPAHTILLTIDPLQAYRRKVGSGIGLTPAETVGRAKTQSEREAFISLQTRAMGFYEDLFRRAEPARVTRIDAMMPRLTILEQATEQLARVLGP
jgi:thymidylate kinase